MIPLVRNGEKKVYILTGPKVDGVMVFGNDYLITFDENDEISSYKALHQNLIPIYYKSEEGEDGMEAETTIHSHLPETGDFMTATDICTLMLYSRFAGWKSHYVSSKKYLNIWDCQKNRLTVVPMKAIKKMNKKGKRN